MNYNIILDGMFPTQNIQQQTLMNNKQLNLQIVKNQILNHYLLQQMLKVI